MKKALFIVLSAFAVKGYSQQNLSLADAIIIALKNSYDIQLAKTNLEISNINNNCIYTNLTSSTVARSCNYFYIAHLNLFTIQKPILTNALDPNRSYSEPAFRIKISKLLRTTLEKKRS